MAKIFVFGSGSFGTALAVTLSSAGHQIVLWGWEKPFQARLRITRENTDFLPGVMIPSDIEIVDDTQLIGDCDVVLIATPTFGVRGVAASCKGKLRPDAVLACVSKGMELSSLKRMSEIISEELPGFPVVALSGPSHAEEVSKEVPTAIVAASKDLAAAEVVQELFIGTKVRIYTSTDLIGVELGGALKNVIAFAAGIIDGMGLGDNSKAALMTRGLTEITRLGVALGAKGETFSGLSGVGDLIVTCTSVHSRNRRAGYLVGQGCTVEQAVEKVGMVVEGITATKCAYQMAQQAGVEMPITNQIYKLVMGETTPHQVIAKLMGRPLKHESESSWLSGVKLPQ